MSLNYVLGSILNDNLQRSANLSFNSTMLYLDVVNQRVGINNANPGSSLDVTGNITIGGIVIPNVGDVTFNNVRLTNVANPQLSTDAATKYYVDQKTALYANSNLIISNTTIYPNFTDSSITIAPQGVGNLIIPTGNVVVTKSVYASKFYGDGGSLTNISANSINLTSISSNIVPSQNVVYSLGSATKQWKELWISGNTIYMSGTSVSLVNGNLSVGGNTLIYASSNGTTDFKNVQANDITASGLITATYFVGDGRFLTNLPQSTYSNANVAAYLPNNSSNVAASYFIGDGSRLTNISYSNIVGTYSNANVASYLPVYTGTITAANASLGNSVSANYFIGDGSLLTNLPVLDAYGNANVAAYLSNPGSSSDIITSAQFRGDGGGLSNIRYSNVVGSYGNSNVAAYLPINMANVSADHFKGDGGQLSNIRYSNVVGAYGNANVAAYLPAYDGNILVDTIQANTVVIGSTFTKNFTTTTANTSAAILCQFDIAQFNSFNYNVTAVDNTGHRCQVTKIIAATINNIVDYSEYGVVNIGNSLGSYEVTAFGGNLILMVHPTTTNLVEYSVSVTNYT